MIFFLLPALVSLVSGTCNSEHDVVMSDGVILTTYIRIPEPCTGKYPAVMDRTPYGTTGSGSASSYNSAGFVSIEQNQRGCFNSGGDYDFWKMDGPDSYDTIAWGANQSWSNGQFYTTGVSADAISLYTNAFVANVSQFLYAQYPTWGSAFGHETSYWGGAYRTGLIKEWLDFLVATCKNAPQMEHEVEAHEAYDSWWADLEANGPYGNYFPNVKWPSVHYAGWWDIFQQPMIDTFNGYATMADPSTKGKHYFFIQPLGHCSGSEAAFGYPQSDVSDVDTMALAVFQNDWSNVVFSRTKHYNLYVLGTVPRYVNKSETINGNYWTSVEAWPTYTSTRYYLTAKGGLQSTPPTTADSLSYKYDPNKPAQTYGGNNLFQICGPRDQSQLEARTDYLVFTASAAITQPLAFCGKINATIFVSTDQVDTDFIVSVNDVYPDGQSIQVRYGALRMRWLASPYNVTLVNPGQRYNATVDLWSTCYIMDAGHTLRVTISSSNAPAFSVNPNNGLPLNQTGPSNIATNTVYLGSSYSSYIELPVVDIKNLPKNTLIQ